MILRSLYNGLGVPSNASKQSVLFAQAHLREKLVKEMGRRYQWLAHCTVAVEAGRYTGERHRLRRVKLVKMLNEIADFLGEERLPELSYAESVRGLCYGYGACNQFAKERGVTEETVFMLSMLQHMAHLERKMEEVG